MGRGKQFHRIQEVLNPLPANDDGSDQYVTAWIDSDDLAWNRDNAQWRLEMLNVACQVLREPGRIQEAKRNVRGEEVVGYCYTGRPQALPGGFGEGPRPLQPWEVVVVFVDMCFRVWDWGIEDCEADDNLQPKDGDGDRYGEVFYPREE